MKIIFLGIFCFILNTLSGQNVFNPTKIRNSILALTKQINRYDSLGYADFHNSLDYISSYDTLFQKATENELFELTNHQNPLVRRSSFYTLLERHSTKTLNLLNKNAADTTQYFNIQYGCAIERVTLLDELLFYLSSASGGNQHFKMTAVQKQKISSMISRRENDKKLLRNKQLEKELQEYLKKKKD